jgi:hypothetical protein
MLQDVWLLSSCGVVPEVQHRRPCLSCLVSPMQLCQSGLNLGKYFSCMHSKVIQMPRSRSLLMLKFTPAAVQFLATTPMHRTFGPPVTDSSLACKLPWMMSHKTSAMAGPMVAAWAVSSHSPLVARSEFAASTLQDAA